VEVNYLLCDGIHIDGKQATPKADAGCDNTRDWPSIDGDEVLRVTHNAYKQIRWNRNERERIISA
jgi:hypothetical protein